MISRVFHDWERRLAAGGRDRLVRPFEWGLDWIEGLERGHRLIEVRAPRGVGVARGREERRLLRAATVRRLPARRRAACRSRAPSRTPHPENNVVRARYFPERRSAGAGAPCVVLPQWNADAEGHVGLCRLLNRFGISALRLSLPYHDARMPPELRRADYIVSANVGRTAQVCRQAVLDARRAIAWLATRRATSRSASWAPASDRAWRC